jgi:hypothetical protein
MWYRLLKKFVNYETCDSRSDTFKESNQSLNYRILQVTSEVIFNM